MKHSLINLGLSWYGLKIQKEQVWELLELSFYEAAKKYIGISSKKESEKLYQKIENDFVLCSKNNIDLIPIFSPYYPDSFLNLNKSPLLLTVLGDKSFLKEQPKITIVGGRNVSLQAMEWIDTELSGLLSSMSLTILSGGARGVDQKAHSIAIRKQQRTVVFLPSGILNAYPSEINNWKNWVLDHGGAYFSPYSPTQEMRKHHFLERNHLMAMLGGYTLAISVRRRSGTMITVKASLEYGKRVGVVPDFPCYNTMGGLDLLTDGADLIRNSMDLKVILEELFNEEKLRRRDVNQANA